MTVHVNRRDTREAVPPFSYKVTLDADGDRLVVEPDRGKVGGLGVSDFHWHVERTGNAAFTLEVRMGGEWVTDDRVAVGDIAGKVHRHEGPFEAMRITQSRRGSDDSVVRITSEWFLIVGGE